MSSFTQSDYKYRSNTMRAATVPAMAHAKRAAPVVGVCPQGPAGPAGAASSASVTTVTTATTPVRAASVHATKVADKSNGQFHGKVTNWIPKDTESARAALADKQWVSCMLLSNGFDAIYPTLV